MAYRYIPDRFVEEIDATLNKLKSYELQGTNTQEERIKKKKKQKERNKKEDLFQQQQQPRAQKARQSFVEPTEEEVAAELERRGCEGVTAEEFICYYRALGWRLKGEQITQWRNLVPAWVKNNYKEKERQLKRERYAKRQTDSANASGTQTNRGNAGQQAPVKARHEQLQEILQEEHFVLQSVVQELENRASPTPPAEGLKGYHQTSEKVVALADGSRCKSPSTGGVGEAFGSRCKSPSTGGVGEAPGPAGTDDRLSTLAADFGPHAVIVWLSKVFEATLVRLQVPDEQFTARQVVQVAEGLLRVLDVYKGLTARQVLRAMERIERIEKGDDIMAAMYSEWKKGK